jgi:hypothetical protein
MVDLVAAVGEKLAEGFDEVPAPNMLAIRDPIARLSFAPAKFLAGATWARLVVQSSQSPTVFGHGAFQGGPHGLQKR